MSIKVCCGHGKPSAYDHKCRHCRSGKEQRRHLKALDLMEQRSIDYKTALQLAYRSI